MRYLSSVWLSAVILLAAIAGCSVKEERGTCPCRLFLDMAEVDFSVIVPLSIYVVSDEGIEHEALLDVDDAPDVYEAFVPRTELSVVGWGGAQGYVSDRGLHIPLGYDCPPVYIHSSSVQAEGEAVYDIVSLRKNHCVLNVYFIDIDGVSLMTVRGGVSGFDMYGKPMPGDFKVSCQIGHEDFSSVQFCLPRQMGDPLYLDVVGVDGKIRTFPLHEYISAAGYDWSEPDLKDLDLTLNYTLTSMSLAVLGWDEEFTFDVVI